MASAAPEPADEAEELQGVWCDECDAFIDDQDITEEGECPTCGTVLYEEHRHVPWYFKFMLVCSVIYLGYRAYQGVNWLAHHA